MKAITLTAAALAFAGPALAQTELAYGSWAPSSDPASVAFVTFAEAVAAEGLVTFDPHFDSSVVQMRTVLALIGDGLVDAGYIAGSIYQAELPIDTMITQYSVIESNPLAISGAVTDFMLTGCPSCVAEVEANNVQPLAYAGTPHFYLMCKNPVADFEQLRGASIRAASANLRFVDYIGATPVNTPTTEVLDAIQRGQVECVVGSVFWLRAYSLWDAVGYVLDLPLGQYNNGLVFGVNRDTWAGLDQAARASIVAHLPDLITEAAVAGNAAAEAVRAESIARGVVWGEPTEAMRAVIDGWFASERGSVQSWGEGQGIADAGAILDRLEASVADWNAFVAGNGGDPAAFRARLQAEVYDAM